MSTQPYGYALWVLTTILVTRVGGLVLLFGSNFNVVLTISPDHVRGRVMSAAILFFDGSLLLGYVLTGWLASRFGAPPGLLICALLCLLVAGAGWLWQKPAEREMAASSSCSTSNVA